MAAIHTYHKLIRYSTISALCSGWHESLGRLWVPRITV